MKILDRVYLVLLVVGLWSGLGLHLTRPERAESQSIDLNLINASVIKTVESSCQVTGTVTVHGANGEMLDGKILCRFP